VGDDISGVALGILAKVIRPGGPTTRANILNRVFIGS